VARHDPVTYRQPHARAATRGVGGEEWVEHVHQIVDRNATARVADTHHHLVVFVRGADRQRSRSTLECVGSVDEQVHEQLIQLGEQTKDGRCFGVLPHGERELFERAGRQGQRRFQDVADLDQPGRAVIAASEIGDATHQFGYSPRGGGGLIHEVGQVFQRVFEIRTPDSRIEGTNQRYNVGVRLKRRQHVQCGLRDASEILGMAFEYRQIGDHHTQRRVDVVRKSLDELPDRGQLFVLNQLQLDTLELLGVLRELAGDLFALGAQPQHGGVIAGMLDGGRRLLGQSADQADNLGRGGVLCQEGDREDTQWLGVPDQRHRQQRAGILGRPCAFRIVVDDGPTSPDGLHRQVDIVVGEWLSVAKQAVALDQSHDSGVGSGEIVGGPGDRIEHGLAGIVVNEHPANLVQTVRLPDIERGVIHLGGPARCVYRSLSAGLTRGMTRDPVRVGTQTAVIRLGTSELDRDKGFAAAGAHVDNPPNAALLSATGVLAVDDEPSLLTALTRLLRPYGLRILTANSGATAIALLEEQSESIGVVISDYTMPGMTGAELLHVVRTRWPDITRVLLTGNADMASASAAVNEGGLSSLFTKPLQPDEFREAITQALAHHRSLVETRRLRKLADDQAVRLEQWNARLESLVGERTEELERANGSLRKGMLETVRLLLVLLEQRLPQRTPHYKAVARLAGRLAERAGQLPEDVRAIQAAALIHDIGLVGLPDALLRPGPVPLTSRVEYEKHAVLGQHMLSSVEQLGDMARWIRHHHERWDGKGYPDRLSGPEIPLPSRLIALAAGFNDAIARDGGSAASWRWAQNTAGEFDPALVECLEAEVSNRPIAAAEADAGKSTTSPGRAAGAQATVRVDPENRMHLDPRRQNWKPSENSVPMRHLRAGMVLAQPIQTAAGGILLREGETLTNRQIERLHALVAEGKVSDEYGVVVLKD
jgi:response regulator RpfG family c-di-GMP phosphodiesterase